MKCVLPIWLALAVFAQAAGLDFSENSKEIRPAPDAETAAIEFRFCNKSEKPVVITKADAGCTCMKVVFAGGKLNYGPGESGVLRAIFELGQYTGAIDRKISLWLDTEPKNPATLVLAVRIQIPVVIELEPKTVKWVSGTKPAPQTIQICMAEGQLIHVTSAQPSTEQFSCALKTVEEGRRYELVVTPLDTAARGICVVRIETDCDIPKHRVQQVYAIVHKPLAADQVGLSEAAGPAPLEPGK